MTLARFLRAVFPAACLALHVAAAEQPALTARVKPVLTVDGLRFKDLNASGTLEPYEDWRLPVAARVADLVSRLTLEEKAGLMLIDTLNAEPGGRVPAHAADFVQTQKMTRFIFRNPVTATPDGRPSSSRLRGAQVTPREAAEFTNALQELAEGTRLGIPALFKSNARNHYDRDARGGINEPAGSLSAWPKEPGLAATGDLAVIRRFTAAMGAEWRALGLRAAYTYMADLATEPRWYRVHETFTEDADLAASILRELVLGLQGGPVSRDTAVALTLKHFPGGGPQEGGFDPHYTFGKNQIYPAGRFAEHLKPFRAAIDAGVSSVMPYYGVPIRVTFEGVTYDQIGMAFSKQIVTDLLRTRLGFTGYVNSDTGIIDSRAWGLEGRSVPERVATAILAGTDVLSGFNRAQTIVDLVQNGLVPVARVDAAVTLLLTEQFALGLFENPYVDAAQADAIVGRADFRAYALDAQRRSIVLLKNSGALPLPRPTAAQPVRLYTLGLNPAVVADARHGGYVVTAGDATPTRAPVPADTDRVVIRVEVTNPRDVTSAYKHNDPATGGVINPATGRAWGADDPAGVDDGLIFGGALPAEVDLISFSRMAEARSWRLTPSLADIRATLRESGDPAKVVLAIYFRQPYVLDRASGLRDAGALLATFGVSDEALMDVLTGAHRPTGKLPFALAENLEAVLANDPDAPGYPAADTLFPFGHGLTYP